MEPLPRPSTDPAVGALYLDIRPRVEQARAQVNQALLLNYWHIGKAIKTQALQGERAAYRAWVLKQNAPIAIILCNDKDAEVVELVDLEPDHFHVAEHWHQLPPKEVLQENFRRALIEARAQLDLRERNSRDE